MKLLIAAPLDNAPDWFIQAYKRAMIPKECRCGAIDVSSDAKRMWEQIPPEIQLGLCAL